MNMARDNDGRPIPVSRPEPLSHRSEMTAEQEQFLLAAKKSDDALRHVEDHARRLTALEQEVDDTLNAKLLDFEKRFDAMMLASLTEYGKRFETMAGAFEKRFEELAESVRHSAPIEPPSNQ